MRRGRARPSRGERMKTQAMGDVFMERMVKKKFESTDALVLLGIIVAMVVVVFIGFKVGFVLMPMPMITFLVVLARALAATSCSPCGCWSTNTA